MINYVIRKYWDVLHFHIFFYYFPNHLFRMEMLEKNASGKSLTIIVVILFFIVGFTGGISRSYGQSPYQTNRIYTNYNGYWTSAVNDLNGVLPENSHELIGFEYNGTVYSTGVNDQILSDNGVTFSDQSYQALPVRNIQSQSITFPGFGQLYDGVNDGASDPPPFDPDNLDLATYLTDGTRGLDIGTGVANIKSGEIKFSFSEIIDPNLIGDGIPDILVSQIADPSSNLDRIFMVDGNGDMVGEELEINHLDVEFVGSWMADFYELDGTLETGFTNTDRDIRLWAVDLSEFGIDLNNYDEVRGLWYDLNGASDPAFVAFNTRIISLLTANNDEDLSNDGVSIDIQVLDNDQPSPVLDFNTLSILSPPGNGVAVVDQVMGKINYTPDDDFTGMDVFTYEVCNNETPIQCDEAIVTVEVLRTLPVTLMEFSGNWLGNNQVKLNWITATEKDHDYFAVEKSRDAVEWQTIGKLDGTGDSLEPTSYFFYDNEPWAGFNYYRLRIVDTMDGVEYSKVISVNFPGKNNRLTVYPNPFKDKIILQGPANLLSELLLVNNLGQIQNGAIEVVELEKNKWEINMENLPKGIYILKTQNGGSILRKN